MSRKRNMVITAIAVATLLTAVKVVASLLTHSMSVMASALDSFMDIFSMLITLFAVQAAEKPADDYHPFGHGKAESVGGLLQSILIAISALFLVFQATHRIGSGYFIDEEALGIFAMCISLIASLILSHTLKAVGNASESTALKAAALNFGADVLSYIGVLVALVLEKGMEVKNADAVISILISANIFISALRIGGVSISQLMDKRLPNDLLAIIHGCISEKNALIRGYHKLKTREVGEEKYIEFHLEIDRNTSFESAHALTEAVIADIRAAIPHAHITVHSDPV